MAAARGRPTTATATCSGFSTPPRSTVAADQKGGGALHVTSKAAGLARLEHYMKFLGGARLEGEQRVSVADEATAWLTSDNEQVTLLGTSWQFPGDRLRQRAAVDGRTRYRPARRHRRTDLAGRNAGRERLRSAPGRGEFQRAPHCRKDDRHRARTGRCDRHQPDCQGQGGGHLPAEGDTPARRIRSTSLVATGDPGIGIQNATFAGPVEYRETRAARKGIDPIDRTAKSIRLDVQTKPGFGDLERAEFHGNVHFTEGTTTTADAPLAIYAIKEDRLDLSPSATGDPGIGPHVSDGHINVDARTIQMVLGTQKMSAETKVRSLMQPQNRNAPQPAAPGGKLPQVAAVPSATPPARDTSKRPGAPAAGQPAAKTGDDSTVKMPSMLKQDEPVNVTANRLDYDGANSLATYTGNARLWQDRDRGPQADTIVLDDKTRQPARDDQRAHGDVAHNRRRPVKSDQKPKAPQVQPTADHHRRRRAALRGRQAHAPPTRRRPT